MEEAWAQVGEIERANRELRWAQLAAELRASLVRRHAAPLAAGRLLQLTHASHRRMLVGQTTLAATARASALPEAALTAPFRRAVRPRGPLARRAYTPAQRTVRPFVEGLDAGTLPAAPPARPPDGLFGFAVTTPARPGVADDVLARISAAATTGASRPPRVASAARVRGAVVSDVIARTLVQRVLDASAPARAATVFGAEPPVSGRPAAHAPACPDGGAAREGANGGDDVRGDDGLDGGARRRGRRPSLRIPCALRSASSVCERRC